MAFLPLNDQPNTSLELVGARADTLVLREQFMGEHRTGREVFFDPRARSLSYTPPAPPAAPQAPVTPAQN